MPLNRDEKSTREACHAMQRLTVRQLTIAARPVSFVFIAGDATSRAKAFLQRFEQHNEARHISSEPSRQ